MRNQAKSEKRRIGALIALAALAVVLARPLGAALTPPGEIAFNVFRNGSPLGHHTLTFRQEGDLLHVEIDILLEVKLAFLTLFRYRHSNHEVWRNGRLVALDTRTNDDGEDHWVRARAAGGGLQVDSSNGRWFAPADIMPTSYWNTETVTRRTLLDTQTGEMRRVEVARGGAESVVLDGRPVPARRYRVSGDLDLDVWYTESGEWAKLSFTARGSTIDYARQNGASPAARPKPATKAAPDR